MLGGAGLVLTAGPAGAAEAAYATECIPPAISGLPPVRGTTKALITAPAEAKVGDEVEIVWKTVQAASKNPDVLDLGKDTVKPSGTITLGGAATGTLNVEGPRQNPAIPKNSPMVLSDMKAKLTLRTAGELTLTPDKYTINVNRPISTDTKCAPKETVPVAARIRVTAGGGGTDSGGTTSGSGGTTTSGSSTSGATTSGSSTSGATTSGGSTGGSTTSSGSTGGGTGPVDFPGKTVRTTYTCTPPGPASIQAPITVNARKQGGDYALTVKTGDSVMNSPAPLPAGAMKGSMNVVVQGADRGTVTVVGEPNKEPVQAGKPVGIGELKGTYQPGATGRSTLSPGKLTIDVTLGGQKIVIPCTVKGTAAVSLELATQQQDGGTTTGGGDSGPTTSGGGLADTGGGDHGTLRALALVAGSVVLLGGAVFTFTPWARLRGRR
ncbi:hypothetical protein [Streptomyces tsukubensis]|uniref:Peptidase n=2 Tax=Streptomyces TaxID=1883 RepID=I2MZC3_STRT9|nr:hypothetical protein [Streptomyces sp. SID5473]AZK94390.1 hypothetical protein B7R87_11355 [Streptomyces tsukubensis]EIF90120.1 hypothetical protein [Streptomyces tsukubensis NRRL18488]MYS63412.1 hypothetical protein [Streptomyces sp. SID5473]QKM69516.1 hypothetical protein STSU_022430 [Streptomyces tsukubensis NRRL18488]TAI42979.1 hypothetical protein EWI31_19095 [Streptomyces tsukubensis]